MFCLCNQTRIRSWNQPVISNEFLAQGNKGESLMGLELDRQASTDYESVVSLYVYYTNDIRVLAT